MEKLFALPADPYLSPDPWETDSFEPSLESPKVLGSVGLAWCGLCNILRAACEAFDVDGFSVAPQVGVNSFCNKLFLNDVDGVDFAVNNDEICFFFSDSQLFLPGI